MANVSVGTSYPIFALLLGAGIMVVIWGPWISALATPEMASGARRPAAANIRSCLLVIGFFVPVGWFVMTNL